MARSLDQVVRDTIGNQAVEILRLTAILEAVQEELDTLKKASESEKAPE